MTGFSAGYVREFRGRSGENSPASQGIYLTSCGASPREVHGGNNMSYTKPVIVAQNNASGSYAAGCPEKDKGYFSACRNCERTE